MFRALIASLLFCALALALASPSQAVVFNGHSGWFWGNPTPQGNDLRAIEFAGTTGYAAGAFGTLIRTTDAGSSWTGLRTGLTADLTRLDVIDGDSVLVGGSCALRRTDDAGQTFRRVPFTPSEDRCTRRLADLSFVTESVGYLVLEDGSVVSTSDGGRSFSGRTAVPGTQQAGGGARPTSALFVSADRGFVTTSAGELFRTTDGGRQWSRVFIAGNGLNDVFISGSTGAVVGNGGAFATTTNGGDTWSRPSSSDFAYYGLTIDYATVRCSGSACLMASPDFGLARTDDGGRTFGVIAPNAFAVDFVSASRAVAVGAGGVTLVSDDGGRKFASISRRLNVSQFGRIRATSASLAHIPGTRGALARTTDGGQTWVNVGVATSAAVLDVSFPTIQRGYALDTEGGLFRTENGGGSWGILDTGTSRRPRAVLAPDATVVLLVGPRGVRRSTDGGDTFAAVRDSDVSERELVDVEQAGGSVVAFGPHALAVTSDRGRTWRSVSLPRRRRSLVHADFVSSRTGFALLSDGRVFSTRDRGRTWRESLAVGNDTGSQLAFADSKRGWLAVQGFAQEGAYVLRTSNGGVSWRPQLLGDGGVGSIAAGSAGAGFAHLLGASVFTDTGLLATATGGEVEGTTRISLSASSRSLTRAGRVELTGELSPARASADVVVSYRRLDRVGWDHAVVETAADGTFELSRRVRRSTAFVAQWRGDAATGTGGSRAVIVRVTRR